MNPKLCHPVITGEIHDETKTAVECGLYIGPTKKYHSQHLHDLLFLPVVHIYQIRKASLRGALKPPRAGVWFLLLPFLILFL